MLHIFVKVKPKAKREYVKCVDGTHFMVAVNAPLVEGRANQAVVKALADYLKVAPSRLMIIEGRTTKDKVVQLD